MNMTTRTAAYANKSSQEVTPFTLAFDLKVFDPITGTEFLHGDKVDTSLASSADHMHMRTVSKSKDAIDDDDDHAKRKEDISPVKMQPESDWSEIKLDPRMYTKSADHEPSPSDTDSETDISEDSPFKLPMHKNCLLTRVAKLNLPTNSCRPTNQNQNALLLPPPPQVFTNTVYSACSNNRRPRIRVRAMALTESTPRAVSDTGSFDMNGTELMVRLLDFCMIFDSFFN
jgi:hypothetical protein